MYIVVVRWDNERWIYHGVYDTKHDANRAANELINSENGVDARCIYHQDYLDLEILNG